MRVIKPGKVSVLTRCYEHNRRFRMGVSVMLFVPLEAEDSLLSEQELWMFLPDRMGNQPVLDVGMPKCRGEFLVHGAAFSPGGAPTEHLRVEAQVGDTAKVVDVFGEREWTALGMTDPEPFVTMPLGWEQAFGGLDRPDNPLGKGMPPADEESPWPLPNVEPSEEPIDSRDQRPSPACFLPVDVMWPQRSRLAGTYDQEWLDTAFPGLASDIDWGYFNIASLDQQREGFWKPGERFRFRNLHPQKPLQEGQLPSFVPRAFVERELPDEASGEGLTRFDEVPLELQTLWFFPDADRAVLLFQGSVQVLEDDGADILNLVCGVEREGPGRPQSYYQEAMDARSGHSLEAASAWLREHELLPEGLSEAGSEGQSADEALWQYEGLSQQNMHNKAVREAEAGREVVASYGLDPDVHGPKLPEPLPPQPPPHESAAVAAELQREAEEIQRQQEEAAAAEFEATAAMVDDLKIEGFSGEDLKAETQETPVGPPQFTAARQREFFTVLAAEYRAKGMVIDELEEYASDDELYADWEDGEKKLREGYRLSAHHQTPAPPLDAKTSAEARQFVLAGLGDGVDFSTFDLTGADLSGLDLRGANLAGALLESSNLDGADLSGACLDRAILAHASLRGTNLKGASIQAANLGKAIVHKAALDEANLTETILGEADLEGASLRGARLHKADLMKAKLESVDASGADLLALAFLETNLSGICFTGAKLSQVNFIDTRLEKTDFSEAHIERSTFVNCSLLGALFSRCTMSKVVFVNGCTFDGARFGGADLTRTNFRGSSLVGCDFSEAILDSADFSETDLSRSCFYRAVAREARYEKAELNGADFRGANLMSAILAKATLHGTDLSFTNLYAADLARIQTDEDTSFEGALMDKARTLPPYTPQVLEDESSL